MGRSKGIQIGIGILFIEFYFYHALFFESGFYENFVLYQMGHLSHLIQIFLSNSCYLMFGSSAAKRFFSALTEIGSMVSIIKITINHIFKVDFSSF